MLHGRTLYMLNLYGSISKKRHIINNNLTPSHPPPPLKVVIQAKPLESLAPCLVRRDGKPLLRNGMIDGQALLESFLSSEEDEEEELLDQEDEADVSLMPQNVRLPVVPPTGPGCGASLKYGR